LKLVSFCPLQSLKQRASPTAAVAAVSQITPPLKSILKKSPESLSPCFQGGKPTLFRGIGGKPIEVTVNYLKLTVDPGCGIFEYEVMFDPVIDSRDERYRAVNQQREKLGQTKSFDGNKLYLPRKLESHVTVVTSIHSRTGDYIKVTVAYKRQLVPGERETIYLYNVCFHKIMKTLKYAQHTRKGSFFDPKAAHDIKVSTSSYLFSLLIGMTIFTLH
jgi:hypothetical protein